MDKSRELYSKEGDNSSRFEGKTVPWEHNIFLFVHTLSLVNKAIRKLTL